MMNLGRHFFLTALIVLGGLAAVRGDESDSVTAVFSSVHNGYTRTKLPDGKFRTETFTFGEGGLSDEALRDETIDKMPFIKIAQIIATPLARQAYLPSSDPEKTGLLIMVYWGTTSADTDPSSSYSIGLAAITPPPSDNSGVGEQTWGNNAAFDMAASMQNRKRDQANLHNAQVLGYYDELARIDADRRSVHRQELIEEIEETRYYVVLVAYDFQTMWKEKKKKLLWVTRFSIRTRNNAFDQSLASMSQLAAKFFGQDSHGLIRDRTPLGRVDLGEPKVIELDPK